MTTTSNPVLRALQLAIGTGGVLLCGALWAQQPDPFAGNNTLYPPDWTGSYRPSNYNYPSVPVAPTWIKGGPTGALTRQNAHLYVAAVKKFLERDIRGLVNEPGTWTPNRVGWYDMPWGGQGGLMSNGQVDPTLGREALLGSYTGQVLQPESYPSNPPKAPFQNHAVVYYNPVAAYQLGKIWQNPFQPDIASAQFPEGSIVVKVESVTLDETQWSVLKNSSVSHIYRPTVASLAEPDPTKRKVVVTPTRFLQMAVRIKDSVASPATGWVFIAFAYDTDARGQNVWERTVPVGATWGNDPAQAVYPGGLAPGGVLQETWVSAQLPKFVRDGLGWGGRLAGPLDLGIRHNAMTVSGKRFGNVAMGASACISCHSAAQYPFVANLYPSPNMTFPREGKPFLLFDPGSQQWAQWFQNRPGSEALSGKGREGIFGTDYDMMLTFALMRANGSADTDAFIRHRAAGH